MEKPLTLVEKLIKSHYVSGSMVPGEGVAIHIDQTLTQDATGTMAYLEFEAMGLPRVKTELSVSYLDHSTLQTSFENMDDHLFLKSTAAKYGVLYSRPGNGICHQVHLERFGKPGKSLVGSDSHTPTAGGIGMLAFGAGGMDVAMAMAGEPFEFKMPSVVKVELLGELRPWVSAKDIILEMLRRLTVRGGVNKAFEFTGPGVSSLMIPARSTITNMATELGAATSVFPSDEITYAFLKAQHREEDFTELKADEGAQYSEEIVIDLSSLEPLVAKPHMPDQVVTVASLKGKPLQQVFVGSCTNASYTDLAKVARILEGKVVDPNVEMCLAPGSRQVYEMLARDGYLANLIASGVRILECACGPCGGSGQAPNSAGVTLRTSNRNFLGRSGTEDAQVFLASAETCAASALAGSFTDASEYAQAIADVRMPEEFLIDDRMILLPPKDGSSVEVLRGPNIKPLPRFELLDDKIRTSVVIKVDDNITTDHIIPNLNKIVKLRSNIPAISQFILSRVDENFAKRINERGSGIIIAGQNYGQGSSREHAALGPKFLGVKAIIAKSFARIHMQNLVNFGVLPLVFANEADYDSIDQDDVLEIEDVIASTRKRSYSLKNVTKGLTYEIKHQMTDPQIDIILAGGLLNYVKNKNKS